MTATCRSDEWRRRVNHAPTGLMMRVITSAWEQIQWGPINENFDSQSSQYFLTGTFFELGVGPSDGRLTFSVLCVRPDWINRGVLEKLWSLTSLSVSVKIVRQWNWYICSHLIRQLPHWPFLCISHLHGRNKLHQLDSRQSERPLFP